MGRRKQTQPTVVAQMVAFRQMGLTQRAIARRVHVSQQAVQQCLARYDSTGSFEARKRTGRPRCTSQTTDRLIHRYAVSTPTASASFISAQLPSDVKPSTSTIRRRLIHDFQLRARRPARRPLLTQKNIRDRLVFARQYRNWTEHEWSQVLFSDESSILQFNSNTLHVRRPIGQRYSSRYVAPTVKKSSSVMVWGAISSYGVGPLYVLPSKTTMNAEHYLTMLQDHLPSAMSEHQCTTFQQDGAPAHTARSVRNWFDEEGIMVLGPWPGNSPDLNPIEHCWSVLKRKVAALKPTSPADLRQKILSVWANEITQDFCRELVSSMPSRIRAVLEAGGKTTRY